MNTSGLIKNMEQFQSIREGFQRGTLGQSFLIVSKDADLKSAFIDALCEMTVGNITKIMARSHPDILHFPRNNNNNLIVADIEEIIEKSVLSPVESDYKIFILHTNDLFSTVCQNKLLKILEEPPKNLFFIIDASSTNGLLPTVLSRVNKIVLNSLTQDEFVSLNLEKKDFLLSGGNLELARLYMEDDQYKELFNKCIQAIAQLKSSADVLSVARELLDKNKISTILQIFDHLFQLFLADRNNPSIEEAFEEFTINAVANIVESIDLAKQKVRSNCNNQAVLDCLLIKIVEEKVKWKKKD